MYNVTNFTRDNIEYVYKECVPNYRDADAIVSSCCSLANESNNSVQCVQFCDKFPQILPPIYLSISCLSAFSCLWVFLSYLSFPRLRQSGYSSKVFLLRTLMDLVIAVGHIIAGIFHLAEIRTNAAGWGCGIIGSVNEAALVASNLWYVILAVDLIKAVRNPFSSRPSYGLISHVTIWSFSALLGIILALLSITKTPGGPGPSMFFWCWVSIESVGINPDDVLPIFKFAAVSLLLYYFWHAAFWFLSLVVVIAAAVISKRLGTSSETRKKVLKQNLMYVIVLAIETMIILPLWIAQLIIVRVEQPGNDPGETRPYFLTTIDLTLAIVFAVVHSLRGTVDLFLWLATFSIGTNDYKDLYKRLKNWKKKDKHSLPQKSLKTPLITNKDSEVNRALRRNAIYCINVGILDAVYLHMQHLGRIQRVGSVRDNFVAGQMMLHDEENQEKERAERYEVNPAYREQSIRRIQFPASATVQRFSFIDLEPSIFSQLRTTYGVSPKKYRESFKIKNAAEIEKEGMLEKFTEGKSGSFFYFTRDYRYIIKTVTSAEESFLQKIAYKYYNHMQNNPNSLIVRFFGMHKVRLAPEQRYITVVVMENIFFNTQQLAMQERYDLKGSWVGRRSIKGSRVRAAYKGCLKDLDLGDKKICVGAENKSLLIEQLEEDTNFLKSCEIMDYSLLLGIHKHNKFGEASVSRPTEHSISGAAGEDFIDVTIKKRCTAKYASSGYGTDTADSELLSPERKPSVKKHISLNSERETTLSETTQFRGNVGVPWFREDYGGLRSNSPYHPRWAEDGRLPSAYIDDTDVETIPVATYYFGIVDILQQYNWAKKVEHAWKTRVQCQDKHGLSAVNEKEYAQRFLNAMDNIFQ